MPNIQTLPSNWVFGLTTDDPAINTSEQVAALKNFPCRTSLRTVFDPGMNAAYYRPSIIALAKVANIMGLPVDSSDMEQTDLQAVQDRIEDLVQGLSPYVSIWEIGNEVNGNWLGNTSDVMAKIEAMYKYAKFAANTLIEKPKVAITFYYENPPTPGYEMISWIDANIPAGHPMRTGLDYVLVSYYEDENNGHQLTQAEIDTMFQALTERFPNALVGFGECGWSGKTPSDPVTRIALYKRFYTYECPSVPAFIGGCFFWEFRQAMVPMGSPDWHSLSLIMGDRIAIQGETI